MSYFITFDPLYLQATIYRFLHLIYYVITLVCVNLFGVLKM